MGNDAQVENNHADGGKRSQAIDVVKPIVRLRCHQTQPPVAASNLNLES